MFLRQEEREQRLERRLSVVKTRGGGHDPASWRFEVTSEGIEVPAPKAKKSAQRGAQETEQAKTVSVEALILIVDDEHAIVETLTEVLRWKGYEVMSAPNGKVALAAMATRRPSLVLLDYMMPVLNGPHTLAAIRKDPGLTDIPVIMLSAMPEPIPPDGARWNEYLRKPFRAPTLLGAIGRCLGCIAAEGELASAPRGHGQAPHEASSRGDGP